MIKTLFFACIVLACFVDLSGATDLFVRPQGCASNIRLIVDDSYRELVNLTVDQCAANCLADGPWCRSFSYFDNPANSTKTCSLNIGASDNLWTGLRYAQFWYYYERITEITGIQNFGIANITTCEPNTFRDCRTASLALNFNTGRTINIKLDNMSFAIPAYCNNENEILMMKRSGLGFYDISWNRPWEDYKFGFGKDLDNFWMGLDFMYRVTNQDVIFRYANNRCMFPRRINGTTTRLTLSDQLQGRCPYWSIRSDGKIVLAMRSLCICEDTVNPGGIGHVQLCGCNEPNRNQFFWSPTFNQIVSKRTTTGNRCLRINGDAGGEEIAVADCNLNDAWQTWTQLRGRYRMFFGGWDISNSFRQAVSVHTLMQDEPWNYKINSDPIISPCCLSCKVQNWVQFSTYDRDRDNEGAYNLALRQAGGDWWSQYSWGSGGEPKLTSMKDVSHFNFCGSWQMTSYLSLVADEFYY